MIAKTMGMKNPTLHNNTTINHYVRENLQLNNANSKQFAHSLYNILSDTKISIYGIS